MEKLYIVCVEDQPEVLETITNQLDYFAKYAVIEECESANEAIDLIEEIDSEGAFLALIISDHVMPGQSGVDFLSEINKDDRFSSTKKILITGQATHLDTIQAINMARIDQYISKPWKEEELISAVSLLLTDFIFTAGLDYQPFTEILNKERLFELLQS